MLGSPSDPSASADPLAGSVSDPQSLDRYAYVLDDPVNLVDPLGLDPEWGCFEGSANWPSCQFSSNAGGEGWYPWITPFNAPPLWSCSGRSGGSPADGGHFTGCDPVYFPPMFLPGDLGGRGGGGGASQGDIIRRDRSDLINALLKDPDCLTFLQGAAGDPLHLLATIPITVGNLSPNASLQATTTFSRSPESLVPSSPAISINQNGVFFTPGFQTAPVDGQVFHSGTEEFQGFVLLHELGHATGALPVEGNPPSQPIESRNNAAVVSHCKKALSSLGGG